MKIVAFAVPLSFADKLQNGRTCTRQGDAGCLPAAMAGFRSFVVNRGARDMYFFWDNRLYQKKVGIHDLTLYNAHFVYTCVHVNKCCHSSCLVYIHAFNMPSSLPGPPAPAELLALYNAHSVYTCVTCIVIPT